MTLYQSVKSLGGVCHPAISFRSAKEQTALLFRSHIQHGTFYTTRHPFKPSLTIS